MATATVAALAATSTASAAASGRGSAPGVAKSGSGAAQPGQTSKTGGKPKAPDAELAAIAATLDVTGDRLAAAMTAAKTSLADATDVTPADFAAAVAEDLGLPAFRVGDALGPLISRPATASGNQHKQDSGGKPGADDPAGSPFSTDAAAASLAEALGVDQAKAKAALATLVRLQSVDTGSQVFADIASSLGVSTDRLMAATADLKRSLANA